MRHVTSSTLDMHRLCCAATRYASLRARPSYRTLRCAPQVRPQSLCALDGHAAGGNTSFSTSLPRSDRYWYEGLTWWAHSSRLPVGTYLQYSKRSAIPAAHASLHLATYVLHPSPASCKKQLACCLIPGGPTLSSGPFPSPFDATCTVSFDLTWAWKGWCFTMGSL